jgi:hypothetical protein
LDSRPGVPGPNSVAGAGEPEELDYDEEMSF